MACCQCCCIKDSEIVSVAPWQVYQGWHEILLGILALHNSMLIEHWTKLERYGKVWKGQVWKGMERTMTDNWIGHWTFKIFQKAIWSSLKGFFLYMTCPDLRKVVLMVLGLGP